MYQLGAMQSLQISVITLYLFELYAHCCIVLLLYASNIFIWINATSVNFFMLKFSRGLDQDVMG